jgi:hypothetical protein
MHIDGAIDLTSVPNPPEFHKEFYTSAQYCYLSLRFGPCHFLNILGEAIECDLRSFRSHQYINSQNVTIQMTMIN